MRAAGRARRAAIALLGCACASPVPDPCAETARRPPRPSVACFESAEGQRYAGLVAGAIADALMGYHSAPGSTELGVDFDATAKVASVCVGSVDGARIAQRLPAAGASVRALPAAPACFAGRRLDFAWEGAEVTHERVRLATRECRRQVEGHRRRNLFCHETQRCPRDEVVRRWDRGDRELRSCVLERIPLEMHLANSAEAHPFVPIAGTRPDPDLALDALDACEALADRESLVGCMRGRGWEPLATP